MNEGRTSQQLKEQPCGGGWLDFGPVWVSGDVRPVVCLPGHTFLTHPIFEVLHTCLFGHQCLVQVRSLHITSCTRISCGKMGPKKRQTPPNMQLPKKRAKKSARDGQQSIPPREPSAMGGGGALWSPGQAGETNGRDWCTSTPLCFPKTWWWPGVEGGIADPVLNLLLDVSMCWTALEEKAGWLYTFPSF